MLTFRGNKSSALLIALLLLDVTLLASPRLLSLSESPVLIPFLCLALLRVNLFSSSRRWPFFRPPVACLQLLLSFCLAHTLLFEPYRIHVTQLSLQSSKVKSPLVVMQLSDLHIERFGPREQRLLETVQRTPKDIIVLTGDYLHLAHLRSPEAFHAARQVLAGLQAPLGVWAIPGNVDAWGPFEELFAGLPITLLMNEKKNLAFEGSHINLIGVEDTDWPEDAKTLEKLAREPEAPEAYDVLLYHSPDLADEAAGENIDLYLCGHTHGGQLRIPWYGALTTLSRHGKRFESGLYPVGSMQLYVSRGIGVEGFDWLPHARFLAPPEVVVITIGPGNTAAAAS